MIIPSNDCKIRSQPGSKKEIDTSNYWKICLHLGSNREIDKVKEYFKLQFPYLSKKATLSVEENKQVQTVLWEIFRFASDVKERAYAGLCLRCYISHQIVITCKYISKKYNARSERKLFSYTDLLPRALNDYGKTLVVLDNQGKSQYILNQDGTSQPIAKEGEFFSVRILQTFNPNLVHHESLNNWIRRLTCQNKDVKSFLWEFGLATPSDEKLLCNVTRPMSKLFSAKELEFIQAFQTVYLRDRLKTKQTGRYSKPTEKQLEEILDLLPQENIAISIRDLNSTLKRIAETLRDYWLYRNTGIIKTVSIEVYDNSEDTYFLKHELFHYTERDPEDTELIEKIQKIFNRFEQIVYKTISKVIRQRIKELENSRYNQFAQLYPEGLRLYYQENLSLSGIAKIWGIEWIKAQRILQAENFLNIVQIQTEDVLLDELLKLLDESHLTRVRNEPDYLENIIGSIREFTSSRIFQKAKAELTASKTPVKNSLFAQIIRIYFNDSINSTT